MTLSLERHLVTDFERFLPKTAPFFQRLNEIESTKITTYPFLNPNLTDITKTIGETITTPVHKTIS